MKLVGCKDCDTGVQGWCKVFHPSPPPPPTVSTGPEERWGKGGSGLLIRPISALLELVRRSKQLHC